MSLSKTALRAARPRAAYFSCAQRRNTSSGSHGHDEHHNADAASYPAEGFASAGWTYTLIAALGIVGFYKFAPSPGEDNYVTRYISHYFTPSGSWASTNNRHLELTASLQEAVQISQSGQRPPVHRYRYPHSLEVASAFSVPVGGDPEVSGVKVKGSSEI
ncbi:hypothetical protein EI94DRAFT_1568737 [Lactarius quietus]|nr:hypothetical protein EI94DRAFT_1568737 [Lactarius quietus]